MLGAKWNFPPRQGKAAFRFGVLSHELISKPCGEGEQLIVSNQTGTASCAAVVSLPVLVEQLAAIAEKHLEIEWRLLSSIVVSQDVDVVVALRPYPELFDGRLYIAVVALEQSLDSKSAARCHPVYREGIVPGGIENSRVVGGVDDDLMSREQSFEEEAGDESCLVCCGVDVLDAIASVENCDLLRHCSSPGNVAEVEEGRCYADSSVRAVDYSNVTGRLLGRDEPGVDRDLESQSGCYYE